MPYNADKFPQEYGVWGWTHFMAEQYAHTLIARQKDFVPSASQVEQFLSAMVSKNVVPGVPSIILRIPTGKFREFPHINPFTGQKFRVEKKDRKDIANLGETTNALESLNEYELEIAAFGRPALMPIPVECSDPYHIGVTCFAYSSYRSTSDPHDESNFGKVPGYNTPCLDLPKVGFFTNPHNFEALEVPEAGYARFWVEFELGKFLFPEIQNGNLNLLNPLIVAEAEKVFGIEFVQGCQWGE